VPEPTEADLLVKQLQYIVEPITGPGVCLPGLLDKVSPVFCGADGSSALSGPMRRSR